MHTTRILTAEDRKGRIYIAGPMTGLPENNFPAFNAKAQELRAQGWHVENPADHGIQEGATWSDYLRHDMARLATCSTIYLLPGWKKSKGALLEFYNGCMLGDFVIIGDEGGEVPTPLMYGIQEPDGSAYMDEGCVNTKGEELQAEVDGLNSSQEPGEGSYRIAALYTMPAPPTIQVQALMEAEAALEVAIARLTKRDPEHAVHVTSEYMALELVRNALTGTQQTPKNTIHNWHLTRAELRGLAEEIAEYVRNGEGPEATDGDDDALTLSFCPAGTVLTDEMDGSRNESPILSLHETDYLDEGIYPIDPSDCKPVPFEPAKALQVQVDLPA